MTYVGSENQSNESIGPAGVTYTVHIYKEDSGLTGSEIAEMLGEDPERVFKTLVTIGNSGRPFVFVALVSKELDLKRAAASVSEKSVSMIPASRLQLVTGYVHGGCSPFSMKHPFVTVVDSSVNDGDCIYVSAGKVGLQIELRVDDFLTIGRFKIANIAREVSK